MHIWSRRMTWKPKNNIDFSFVFWLSILSLAVAKPYVILSISLLFRPDTRVVKLIERMGAKSHPRQKRVLCMNKIDLVEKRKDLLKVAQQFKDLPAFERSVSCNVIELQDADIKLASDYFISSYGKVFHDFGTKGCWSERSYSVLDGAGKAQFFFFYPT